MQNYPDRNPEGSGSADLPRPKNTVPPPPASTGRELPPVRRTAQPRPQNPQRPQNVQRPQNPPPRQGGYGSDTMQFRAVQQPVDTDFERRRAAQASQPRRPAPQPQYRPAPPPPPKKAKKRRKKRKSILGRIIGGICVFLAVVFLIYSGVALLLISRLDHVKDDERSVTNGALSEDYVTSILLIGTDARDEGSENGRSDSMILLSVNSRTRTIHLSSFMRDAYVQIPGHGSGKLNAAYSYGGAPLLMDTLEKNYDVSIDDYVTVSFSGFAGIIDAVGGVEVTLSDSEADAVNEILMSEVNELMGKDREDGLLRRGGTLVLDGKQALSYARIRYVGNADFERTSRQREVMTAIFSKLKTTVFTAVPKLISAALPHMATNMTTGEMYLLSLRLPLMAGYKIEQQQIPADGTWSGQTIDGQSVLVVDFDENIEILEDTVYAPSR